MSEQNLQADRREFIKYAGAATALSAPECAAGLRLGRRESPAADRDRRLRRARHGARSPTRSTAAAARPTRSSWSRWPTCSSTASMRVTRRSQQQYRSTPELVAVPEDKRFVGFDAYKKAMDCLRPGDIAIFATPLAFRWLHFQYAIDRGLNVFMEKPLVADASAAKKMLDLAKKADEKNLKVGVGLMIRHCRARQELHKRHQRRRDRRHHCDAGLSHARPRRQLLLEAQARTIATNCRGKSNDSTASCGPAAACSTTSTSTRSTKSAG